MNILQKYSKNCYNKAKYCHNRHSFDTDILKKWILSCPITYQPAERPCMPLSSGRQSRASRGLSTTMGGGWPRGRLRLLWLLGWNRRGRCGWCRGEAGTCIRDGSAQDTRCRLSDKKIASGRCRCCRRRSGWCIMCRVLCGCLPLLWGDACMWIACFSSFRMHFKSCWRVSSVNV